MPRSELDRLYAERRAQLARFHRIVTILACAIFALAIIGTAVGIYLAATTTPEQIGAWLGRLSHAFRGAE